MSKQRLEDRESGSIFVPGSKVDADTIAAKVKTGEWIRRSDLDDEAKKVLAARERAEKAAKAKADAAPAE